MARDRDGMQFVTKLIAVLLTLAILTVYNSINNANDLRVSKRFSYKNNKTKLSNKANLTEISLPPKGYLVWSDNCHIPSMDPFQPEYMDYERVIGPVCTDKEQLIMKLFNATTKEYTLHINTHYKNQYLPKTDNISCCYEKIKRNGDHDYDLDDCKTFPQDFLVPNHIDYMLINCRGIKNTTVFYKDGITFVQERINVKEKFANNTQSHRSFGILLFGIDTISQFNLRRIMPKTFHYLQNNNWFELSGYNKIGDNTFPNLIAAFSGLSLDKFMKVCNYHELDGMDNCTTLFKSFNEQGLATAYAEDECPMSTFNYLKPGFVKSPTDYYQRPFFMAIESKLPEVKLTGLKFCMGPRRAAEYIYDFGIEFAERFLGKSIFGLFWANSFSHNDWRDPATMDQRMVDYFHEMDYRDIFKNNAVLFFSDHGNRWGPLRRHKEGFIEERLPMFFLHLPQWFQSNYPDMVWSLKRNKNRLTSPYDLHMTLKHLALISLGKENNADEMAVPLSCPTCQTLFKPVHENRTCSEAGIEDHWCTCTPYENIPGDYDEMINMTKLVVVEMNEYLRKNGFEKKCAPLVFKENNFSNLKLELHEDSHNSTIQTYRMTFVTRPNDAEFDGTFIYNKTSGNITIDVTEISRLNVYAEDSPCIDDAIAKKYCICNESIKKDSKEND